jgi:hypothetical protein
MTATSRALARLIFRTPRPLHGRVKRLGRFLDNPHLDETALFVRWLKLTSPAGSLPISGPGLLSGLPLRSATASALGGQIRHDVEEDVARPGDR